MRVIIKNSCKIQMIKNKAMTGVEIMAEITYEIKKHLGILGEDYRGWTKEINLVSWNNRHPKLDIRDWDPDHAKMGKGITLSMEEALKLKAVLEEINLDDLEK
jgi:hypothetical protein